MKVNVKGRVRLGLWRKIIPVPSLVFNVESSNLRKGMAAVADLLSEEERMIHHFIVRELPNIGKPMTLAFISHEMNLPMARVEAIVDKLEKVKTFIFRSQGKGIDWAYPATVADTPHHVTFSTGEQVYAA
jgi:hypothetical protein